MLENYNHHLVHTGSSSIKSVYSIIDGDIPFTILVVYPYSY